jgi:hypothetical protein
MRYQQLRPMRRLTIMTPQRQQHFTLWNVGSQQLQVAFDGGPIPEKGPSDAVGDKLSLV